MNEQMKRLPPNRTVWYAPRLGGPLYSAVAYLENDSVDLIGLPFAYSINVAPGRSAQGVLSDHLFPRNPIDQRDCIPWAEMVGLSIPVSIDVLRKLINYAFEEIEAYDELEPEERSLLSQEDFDKLKQWSASAQRTGWFQNSGG